MILSIIIVSFNTKLLTLQCLESIKKNYQKELSNKKFEILVVDNNSQDETVLEIKNKFPEVLVIESKENVGFSKGNNKGAASAQGNYLLFLNSDTKLIDSNLQLMMDFLDKRKDVGILGGTLFDNLKNKQKSAGYFYTLWNMMLMLFGASSIVRFTPKSLQQVDWVEGSFFMIKRKLFEALQGFDEHFFMYVEDMELCFRAKKAGYKTYFTPESSAIHIGHASSNKSFAIMHIYKGILLFYEKHATSFEYRIVKVLLWVKALITIIIGVLTLNKYLIQTYKKVLSVTI